MQENSSICCDSVESCSVCCESDNYDNSESDIVPVFEDFSTLRRLLRVTSLVFRFIYNARNEKFQLEWKFIVEGAPWWGGFWERLVRSVKNCLKCVLGKTSLMYEELNTVLIEVEVVINSRLLTYVYNDANVPDPLTPSHFTVGSRLITLPSPKLNANSINVELTKKWKYRQLLLDHFWKRFFKEYLLELRSVMFTKQSKNIPNLKIDDVVLIREDNVKRYNWKLGRIKKLLPGRDGKVRY
ncbi:integrase catalytic domain-containing protein [Trichonephila clavata]|uniref:Integrase catalytic domain-containing protein n=1 Tax=Trichonephila clavata TaxID=2740835 RepID=A0A8X6IN96_TRICU|nr:integrase catalytic domain-containing protein [Trichonephila clavata]